MIFEKINGGIGNLDQIRLELHRRARNFSFYVGREFVEGFPKKCSVIL